MKLNVCMRFCAVTFALFCGVSTIAHAETTFDGLDLGDVGYVSLNARPDKQWQQDAALQRRVTKTIDACFTACHGPEKRQKDSRIPKIAGQKYYYVLKQLEVFDKNNIDKMADSRSEWSLWERSDENMNRVTSKVATELFPYLSDVLDKMECSSSEPGTRPPSAYKPPPQLVEQCTSCHGVDGLGTAYNVPILAGQSQTYLRKQLLLIRDRANGQKSINTKSRRNHPLMEAKIKPLSDVEIGRMAKYYAGLDCRSFQAQGSASTR
ncbi:c-type cytochrome [Magnetovibrio sp.]|uniref:c-type cytochrome n=1 Tax=Magnetovibrio sp. TaxID=2024836 RepID=UPI002F92C880